MFLPRKRPRPETARTARPGRIPAAAFPLALLAPLALGACRASGAVPPARGAAPPAVAFASADNLPAFRALEAALAEEEDALARGILGNLRGRGLTPRELELVESAERVLAGRELVRALDLRLESEPVPDSEAYRLVLVARSDALADVRLRLPPADLKRFQSRIDARGFEGLDFESKGTAALRDLALAPTVERRIPLVEYELPLGRALAVRERRRLETRSGAIESAGTRYPAARVAVAGSERERISPLVAPPATETAALGALPRARPAATPAR
jgi:hypothetical protein